MVVFFRAGLIFRFRRILGHHKRGVARSSSKPLVGGIRASPLVVGRKLFWPGPLGGAVQVEVELRHVHDGVIEVEAPSREEPGHLASVIDFICSALDSICGPC